MSMFLATFAIMVLAALGMAIGVITGRRELKGSCGGLNAVDGGECPCGRQNSCDEFAAQKSEVASGNWTP